MKIVKTPTIRRMPTYLHRLFRLRMSGQEWVSCAELAQYMNIPHIMVRKDIAMTGLPGHKRHGYKVVELIDAILKLLNWDKTSTATLIGAGSLGAALLGFDDFNSYNFRIESVFDSSPDKIGKMIQIKGKNVTHCHPADQCKESAGDYVYHFLFYIVKGLKKSQLSIQLS